MKISINGGHFPGLDDGERGLFSTEAEVARELMQLASGYLRQVGYLVLEIQENDLADIVDRSNAFGADLLLSIHCGGDENAEICGTEVYYGKKEAQSAAQAILAQIVQTMEFIDRGVRCRPELYLFKHVACAVVLVNVAYITNEEDEKALLVGRDALARAIARGVTDYHAKMKELAAKNREIL